MSFVILATIANEIDASKDFTTAKGVVCDLPTR
jgi:hypothetical protein